MKIEVFPQYLFDEDMERMGLNDENVENTNMAFISIIGTDECLKYHLDEPDTKHYFKDHPNVLNIEFDDTATDINYGGHIFKTMSMEQAEKTVNFVENAIKHKVDVIKIHCRAGYSRSRATAEWICRYCQENGINIEYADRNEYTMSLNHEVLRRLNHAYWKKHKLGCYANGEEYDDALIHTEVVENPIINENNDE